MSDQKNFVPRHLRETQAPTNAPAPTTTTALVISKPDSKMVRTYNYRGRKLLYPDVETRILKRCKNARKVYWDASKQLGSVEFASEAEALDALKLSEPDDFFVVKYFSVENANGYFSIVVTNLPEKWQFADILDALNDLYGSDTAHFMGGIINSNKTDDGGEYYYAFVWTDSRAVGEQLIKMRNVNLSYTPVVTVVVKRAADRSDTLNSIKGSGIPSHFSEENVTEYLSHVAGIQTDQVDHVFIVEKHDTGASSGYCFIKLVNEAAYLKCVAICGTPYWIESNKVTFYDNSSTQKLKGRSIAPSQPLLTTPPVLTPARRNETRGTPAPLHQLDTTTSQRAPLHHQVAPTPVELNLLSEIQNLKLALKRDIDNAVATLNSSVGRLREDFTAELEDLRNEVFAALNPDAEVDAGDDDVLMDALVDAAADRTPPCSPDLLENKKQKTAK